MRKLSSLWFRLRPLSVRPAETTFILGALCLRFRTIEMLCEALARGKAYCAPFARALTPRTDRRAERTSASAAPRASDVTLRPDSIRANSSVRAAGVWNTTHLPTLQAPGVRVSLVM